MLDNLPFDRPSQLRLPCHAWLLGSSQQVLRYCLWPIDTKYDSTTHPEPFLDRVVEALLHDLMSPGTARRGRRYDTYSDRLPITKKGSNLTPICACLGILMADESPTDSRCFAK